MASHPSSYTPSPPESPREIHHHHRRPQIGSPTQLSVSCPKIAPPILDVPHENHHHHRRPQISSPTQLSISCPKIAPPILDAPRKRRNSTTIRPPPINTSLPDVYPSSPLKQSSSSINSPLSSSPHKQLLFSPLPLDDHPFEHDHWPQTRKWCIIPPPANNPPHQVCAEINQRIRSTLNYPNFDFSQHVQRRSYVVRTQYFKHSECVTMLDTTVDDLLQPMFENLPPQPDPSLNIDIRTSPGKGFAMFSRKKISSGEAFFVEYPTVITPYVIGLSISLSALYEDIFTRLSAPVFREVMDLSCSSLISGDSNDVHEAIMRINALAIELPVPGGKHSELSTHRALFLQTSRCNHRLVFFFDTFYFCPMT